MLEDIQSFQFYFFFFFLTLKIRSSNKSKFFFFSRIDSGNLYITTRKETQFRLCGIHIHIYTHTHIEFGFSSCLVKKIFIQFPTRKIENFLKWICFSRSGDTISSNFKKKKKIVLYLFEGFLFFIFFISNKRKNMVKL